VISLLQRVRQARVDIGGLTVGRIDHGLLVLVCAEPGDTEALAERLVEKWLKLRIFSDAEGKMNRSVADVGGGLLIVSQFTLAADPWSGNRPSFTGAAPAADGERLYQHVLRAAGSRHPVVESGRFGADMQVHLVNDGPVTIPVSLRL
jgi:D-tyrosyl-tRNA(Tyr) deacylase